MPRTRNRWDDNDAAAADGDDGMMLKMMMVTQEMTSVLGALYQEPGTDGDDVNGDAECVFTKYYLTFFILSIFLLKFY